jgi:hypothetical protein
MFRQRLSPEGERRRAVEAIAWLSRHGGLVCLLAASFAAVGANPTELTFDLRVENGRVPENMRLVRVIQGDVVKLRWHVDRPIVLHLHGYDIEKRVEPGTVGEMSFTARATGRFPLHAHTSGAPASDRAHDEAPLLYVEVYPR